MSKNYDCKYIHDEPNNPDNENKDTFQPKPDNLSYVIQ